MTSKSDEGCTRGFSHLSRAWYANANLKTFPRKDDFVDEVNLGMYDETDGGTTGEMSMRWYKIREDAPPYARLEVFNDGWRVLASWPDVVARLGTLDDQDITPLEFCAVLVELGFKDRTQKEHPNA
jgi:hypothetical protein